MTNIPSGDSELPEGLSEILELAGRQENGVPKGLTRCRVCGDWTGRCIWPDPLMWHKGPTHVSCRCRANLCARCGEPIYEYRLGSNVYVEAIGKISKILHVPGIVGASHRCGGPRIEPPIPIQPFWDEKYSPLLAGFPVELVYVGVRPRKDESGKPIVVKARYRLDAETFLETNNAKEMRYVSSLPSDYYVEVIWSKGPTAWRTAKHQGRRLLFHATGRDFEQVMTKTLIVGLQPDEPAT